MTRMRSTTPTPSSPAPPPLTPGTLRIERVEAPSLAHFFETYAERQTPVIITNYSHIFSGMSLANIESACGQASVSASRRAEESGNWASLEQCEASRSLAEHMRELSQAAPADGADSVGIFDMPLFSVCPSLLEQHFVMPKYFAQDFMQRVPPATALKYRDSWPSLFIGMNGTYVPQKASTALLSVPQLHSTALTPAPRRLSPQVRRPAQGRLRLGLLAVRRRRLQGEMPSPAPSMAFHALP